MNDRERDERPSERNDRSDRGDRNDAAARQLVGGENK
jgi:hypothetical protein